MHIIIAIDTSSSMKDYIKNAVNGLNNFLIKLKNKKDNIFITVITFNNNPKYILRYTHVNDINFFDDILFKCEGLTCLYDTICLTLLDIENLIDDKTHFFIISDGNDTYSDKYKKEDVDVMCNIAKIKYNYNIKHCHTDYSILDIPTINYDINSIENLLSNLEI